VGDIQAADVLKLLTPVWVTKPEKARRVIQLVRERRRLDFPNNPGIDDGNDTAVAEIASTDRSLRR
jgi:hypothetical protein